MHATFKSLKGSVALTLREDFCGTSAISHSWVRSGTKCKAYGIDLDTEPIEIGKIRHGKSLNPDQKKRLFFLHDNVLTPKKFKVDIVCAFNFSYFIFKERELLIRYFKQVKNGLNKNGLFFMDLFGGPESQNLVTDTRVLRGGLKYYWECQYFNPINNHCTFAIHFKHKNVIYKNVFEYHWRLWTIAELRECLEEAGFKQSIVYWEGDGKDGSGDGIFTPHDDAENSLAWVSYIVAGN